MQILLTNDDGWEAEGLKALRAALAGEGRRVVVAPEHEQSGVSHALTLNRPLRLKRRSAEVWSVDGTPADCVLLALRGLPASEGFRPDLIASGINHGANLGDDVLYSGTVAAAMEGSLLGIPSIAFSIASFRPTHLADASLVAKLIVDRLAEHPLPKGLLLNVNLPDLPRREMQGIRVAKLGSRQYEGPIEERQDPRGQPYYWVGGSSPVWRTEAGTDQALVHSGWVAVTPLHLDLTDYAQLEAVTGWLDGLPCVP